MNPDGTVFETISLTDATVTDLQRATIELGDVNSTSMFADQISFSYQKMTVTAEPSGSTANINGGGAAAIP